MELHQRLNIDNSRGIILTVFLMYFLGGCRPDMSYYLFRNFEGNEVKTETIGSPMVQTVIELKNNDLRIIESSLSSELIYQGAAGSVIKIVYREYANNYARSAFDLELQYDLNESRIIKFRRTTIEVLNASNQEIRFKVIEAPTLRYRQGVLPRVDVGAIEF